MKSLFTHERFGALTPDDVAELTPLLGERVVQREELLFREGEPSAALYFVLEGVVRIFTEVDGAEVELHRHIAGSLFGEQSLLPGRRRVRGASARALLRTRLVEAPVAVLERVLQRDGDALQALEQVGAEQARSNILRRSRLLRLFALSPESPSLPERSLVDGERLFSRGEPSSGVYLVVRGALEVLGENNEVLNRVRAGDLVGELAALDEAPRAATVVARGEAGLLVMDAAEFRARHAASKDLQDQLRVRRRGYRLDRGYGRQYAEQVLGREQLTTVVELTDGRRLVASRIDGSAGYRVEVLDSGDVGVHQSTLRHHGPDGALWFNVAPRSEAPGADAVVVGFEALVDGPEASALYSLALDRVPLSQAMQQALSRRGALDEPPKPADPVTLCRCLAVPVDDVQRAIAAGDSTVSAVCERTGCGAVCGACRARVGTMLEASSWQPVRLQEVVPLAGGLRALRLVPERGAHRPHLPGQELQLRARVGQAWQQGGFLLTSPSARTEAYELIVHQDSEDALSRHLLGLDLAEGRLEVAPPSGRGAPTDGRPLICFVADHGVAPVLCLLRSRGPDDAPVVVHWVVSRRAAAPWLEELQALARGPGVELTVQKSELADRPGL